MRYENIVEKGKEKRKERKGNLPRQCRLYTNKSRTE